MSGAMVNEERPVRGLASVAAQAREWLFNAAFPRWWPASAAPSGFYDRLTPEGPTGGSLRARVQARQTYAYAAAGRLGWHGPWREAVVHGSRFMLQSVDPQAGLVPSSFDLQGRPAPGAFDLYDQAFYLFGHAHAYAALGDEAHRTAARTMLETLTRRQGRRDGGFDEDSPPRPPLRSNPHMHLLEAALAWRGLDPDGPWGRLAEQICDLAVERLIDPRTGRLLEYFDETFEPLADDVQVTEPGHQFEWCSLLTEYALTRGDAGGAYINRARALADLADRTGIDRRRDVAVNAQSPCGQVVDPDARLWPQTERLRAACMLARSGDPGEQRRWEAEAENAWRSITTYLDKPALGLWRDTLSADGTFDDQPTSASTLYHLVSAIEVLISTAGAAPRLPS